VSIQVGQIFVSCMFCRRSLFVIGVEKGVFEDFEVSLVQFFN